MSRPNGAGLTTLLLTLIAAVLLSACGSTQEAATAGGSTINRTLLDTDDDGLPERGPGEPLLDRTEVAPKAPLTKEIARIGVLNDPQIRDEESPARVPFLDRLGAPFTSTFRPHEALSTRVLAAGVEAITAQDPDAVVLPGDLADNAQRNELEWAAAILNGERVDPDSGDPGYDGVQRADNPDPFYYRPGVDAPQQPGLLSGAQQPFTSRGLGVPWFPVMGNHDILVQGEVPPTPELEAVATGDEAVERLDEERLEGLDRPPDSRLAPQILERLLASGQLPGETRGVPADPARTFVGPQGAIDILRDAAAASGAELRGGSAPPDRLDYAADLGPGVRLISLDVVNREGVSRGVVLPEQRDWLAEQLEAAGDRWVIVSTHQPLDSSIGGPQTLALLDANPRMLAVVHGHTHVNEITPRDDYWVVSTASLTDWPLQGRMLAVHETEGGGAAIETWVVDIEGRGLAARARELAHLDAQGGRPDGDRGEREDRNVRLFVPPPS
ncbi:MAG TPA: metallophosphoesterase [Solirubrobacteraceae bacterium]|nr:metallophosphoesterase [Solirubrobacteraceae bacterium]